jgi:2-keto-4-pentenoate hydratase/2-oxohepta-3-ene-1,7-dioic acid hydratase in catechol pathway
MTASISFVAKAYSIRAARQLECSYAEYLEKSGLTENDVGNEFQGAVSNMTYRLATYRGADGVSRAGIIVGDNIYNLEAEANETGISLDANPVRLVSFFQVWESVKNGIAKIGAGPKTDPTPLSEITLEAPVQYPGVLYMAGANYADHLKEMGVEPPDKSKANPFFFIKTTKGTVIGPGEEIVLPSYSKTVDWEAEIAMVIGKPGRNLTVENAMECVAGYTICNDLSARDRAKRDDIPFRFDWIGHKCFDTSCPMGPSVTPAEHIGDPDNLSIKLWVNDTLHQNSNTSNLIWNYPELLAWLTQHVTVYPGDVVSTGTPAGVGAGKNEFLQHGDTVRIEIENIGEISNPVVRK